MANEQAGKRGFLKFKPSEATPKPVKVTRDLGNGLWSFHRGVRQNEEAEYHELVLHLDFKDCTREDLIQVAARSIIIAAQNEWRASFKAKRDENSTTNVEARYAGVLNVKRDIIAASRSSVTPEEKRQRDLAKLLSGMTVEEKQALAKVLQG